MKISSTVRAFLIAGTVCVAAPVMLSACSPVEMALDDRYSSEIYKDSEIKTLALRRVGGEKEAWLHDINVDVWKGKVMLSGLVEDPLERSRIVELVNNGDDDIKAFYDHLAVMSPSEAKARRAERAQNETVDKAYVPAEAALESVSDNWIETKVRAGLISVAGSRSSNYRWRSVRGEVFLLGESGSQDELDNVLQNLRTIKGVKSITSYLDVVAPRE